jgi:phosphatidylglycerol:prolipoprotein diacylglycerol transferase
MSIIFAVLFCIIAAFCFFPIILKKPKYQIRDFLSKEPVVREISIFVYLDAIAPAVLVGQFIGRWGNYANLELFGPAIGNDGYANFIATILPLMRGSIIANGNHGHLIDTSRVYHPFFLYEGILNLVGFGLLYFVCDFFCNKKKTGDIFYSYLI